MYSIAYLYSTGIRAKGVSLKNTELKYQWIDTKGGGLNKRGRVGNFVEVLYWEGVIIKWNR